MVKDLVKNIYSRKSQALLEVAILSAIIMFAIGVLVQVGLNYNTYQDMAMRAFRNALWVSLTPIAREFYRYTAVTVQEDKLEADFQDPVMTRTRHITPYTVAAHGLWTNKLFYDYSAQGKWGEALQDIRDRKLPDALWHIFCKVFDLPASTYIINKETYYVPTSMYSVGDLFGTLLEEFFKKLPENSPLHNLPVFLPIVPLVIAFEKVDNHPFGLFNRVEEEDSDHSEDYLDEIGIWRNYLEGQPTRMWHWRPVSGKDVQVGDEIVVPRLAHLKKREIRELFEFIIRLAGFPINPPTNDDKQELRRIMEEYLLEDEAAIVVNKFYLTEDSPSYNLLKTIFTLTYAIINPEHWQEEVGKIMDALKEVPFVLLIDPNVGAMNLAKDSAYIWATEKPYERASKQWEEDPEWDYFEIPKDELAQLDGISISYTKEANIKRALLKNTHTKDINLHLADSNINLDSGTINYWYTNADEVKEQFMNFNERAKMIFNVLIRMNNFKERVINAIEKVLPGDNPILDNIEDISFFDLPIVWDEVESHGYSISIDNDTEFHEFQGWVTEDVREQ